MRKADQRLAAAIRKTGASKIAVAAVRESMSDGTGRTDEEIAFGVEELRWSPDTIRHARLALELAGLLKCAGSRLTRYSVRARVWVRK